MAISFKNTKGKAGKSVETYNYKDGENRVRLVGDVLPRYVYWMKNGQTTFPIECLAFDRNEEKFTNKEADPVAEEMPGEQCSWNYVINCIDRSDGTIKALALKKKLFGEIITAAEDLGDPTDPDTGWDIVFQKTKDGPNAFNVSYSLKVLRCKATPLTDAEKAMVAEEPTIDEKFPRPTVEEVRRQVARLKGTAEDSDTEESHGQGAVEAANEL